MPEVPRKVGMRVLILGGYGTGNRGDDLILGSLARLLGTAYPEADVRAFSYDPALHVPPEGVTLVPVEPYRVGRSALARLRRLDLSGAVDVLGRRRATDAALEWADLLVLGGGNVLTDHPFYFLEHFTGQIARRAVSRGVELAVLGVGYGPMNTSEGERLLARLAEWARVVIVREESAADAFRRVGRDDVVVAGDPVLLDPPPLTRSTGSSPGQGTEGVDAVGGAECRVSLRPLSGEGGAEIPGLRAGIDLLRARFRLRALPMDPSRDDPLLARYLTAAETAVSDAPDALVAGVSSSRFVLGMRLHSLILAAAAGVPFVGIGYHRKVREFVVWLGAGEVVDPYTADQGDLPAVLRDVLDQGGVHGRRVAEAASRKRRLGLELLDSALGALPFPGRASLTAAAREDR